jgi:3-oxoadipate enol-lactonase
MSDRSTVSIFCRFRVGEENFFVYPGGDIPAGLRKAIGSGGSIPCVFIHAFPLDSRMWEPSLEFVAQEGYPVLAVDLLGFGRSQIGGGSSGTFSIAACGAEVIDCLEALEIERAVLVGCSMGGYVIFSILRKRPAVAAGLLLADTRATADTAEARAARFEAIKTIESGGLQSFLDGMIGKLLAPRRAASDTAISAKIGEIMNEQNEESIVAALRGLAERDDYTDVLPTIRVPVTVVVGEDDVLVPVSEAESLASAIPTASLEIISGSGHLPNIEAPGAFNSVLKSLLDRVTEKERTA